jgi:hypothetical protein
MLLQSLDDFIDTSSSNQVGVEQGEAESHDMAMGVDQSRNDHAIMIQVDEPGLRKLGLNGVVVGDGENDPVGIEGHGLCSWLLWADCDDAGIDDGRDLVLAVCRVRGLIWEQDWGLVWSLI